VKHYVEEAYYKYEPHIFDIFVDQAASLTVLEPPSKRDRFQIRRFKFKAFIKNKLGKSVAKSIMFF
jgi:hypothetical protein